MDLILSSEGSRAGVAGEGGSRFTSKPLTRVLGSGMEEPRGHVRARGEGMRMTLASGEVPSWGERGPGSPAVTILGFRQVTGRWAEVRVQPTS